MLLALPQPRPPKHRPALGATPWLVALLLAVLQVATPFAHAMLHASSAGQTSTVQAGHHYESAWTGTVADEKPCPLCAADHLPALPEAPATTTTMAAARACTYALPVFVRSSAPLDLFCRPPPVA